MECFFQSERRKTINSNKQKISWSFHSRLFRLLSSCARRIFVPYYITLVDCRIYTVHYLERVCVILLLNLINWWHGKTLGVIALPGEWCDLPSRRNKCTPTTNVISKTDNKVERTRKWCQSTLSLLICLLWPFTFEVERWLHVLASFKSRPINMYRV